MLTCFLKIANKWWIRNQYSKHCNRPKEICGNIDLWRVVYMEKFKDRWIHRGIEYCVVESFYVACLQHTSTIYFHKIFHVLLGLGTRLQNLIPLNGFNPAIKDNHQFSQLFNRPKPAREKRNKNNKLQTCHNVIWLEKNVVRQTYTLRCFYVHECMQIMRTVRVRHECIQTQVICGVGKHLFRSW